VLLCAVRRQIFIFLSLDFDALALFFSVDMALFCHLLAYGMVVICHLPSVMDVLWLIGVRWGLGCY